MKPENLTALLSEIDQRKKSAENIAQMKAMDYVKSADEKDRECAKSYLRDADIWNQARLLIIQHSRMD